MALPIDEFASQPTHRLVHVGASGTLRPSHRGGNVSVAETQEVSLDERGQLAARQRDHRSPAG